MLNSVPSVREIFRNKSAMGETFQLLMVFFCVCIYKCSGKDNLVEWYGHITQKRVNTKVGHYFLDLTVAKPVYIELICRHKMKDIFMIFLMVPHNQVWLAWFDRSALSKWSIFSPLPEKCRTAQALKIIVLTPFLKHYGHLKTCSLKCIKPTSKDTNSPNFHNNMKESRW